MIGLRRRLPILLALTLLPACLTPPDTTRPSPSPTVSSGPTRPRFELSTYQYALQTKGRIRVAIRDASAPMSARGASGVYEGFEADLAREIARAIWGPADDPNAHIEWVPVDASTRVSAHTSDQADITLAGIAASDEARKVIDLSDTYLRTGQRFLVKKANEDLKELADVASGDQTVCAVRDSAALAALRRVSNDRAKILELQTTEFCLQALASGAADAFTDNELVLYGLAAKDPNTKVVAKPFTDDRLAIGIKKNANAGRQGFLDFVNGALLRIVADRTWARIYEKDIAPLSGEKKQLPTD